MRPEQKSQTLLGVTRSKAKMFEYNVPNEHHINIPQDPAKLFTLTIAILGDLAAGINRGNLNSDALVELRKSLLFSAHFFDAYMQSKLNQSLDPYMILLGSASYYLCELPGSSAILARQIGRDRLDLGGEGLEDLLLWLLRSQLSNGFHDSRGCFGEYIESISLSVIQFFNEGTGAQNLIDLANRLRSVVYELGTPRQLLLGDVIVAVIKKKLFNSSWNALPIYSGLSRDKWSNVLRKESFIKELWPAQHLLGQKEVLKGASAVVQMPTSAGKTKATELIIRSAFLSGRTSLAIIVAPFRALCHEIKNSLVSAFQGEAINIDELSDVLQTDFEITELLGHKQILVVTPEKLLHVLRHTKELALNTGLLIFDEGHQFDSGTRGITYELLLTSLRLTVSEKTQKILISAVISNAEAVGEWLNYSPRVVAGTDLMPTFRSIGFVSWLDQLGRIEYVSSEDMDKGEFFVPRVIEGFKQKKKPREIKARFFPEKSDGQSIALYLGLKLASNGSIAIFCGRKTMAVSISEKTAEIIERGVDIHLPVEFSNQEEIDRLYYLHAQNLGSEAPTSKCVQYGIFSHHSNIPHGIRLAVEHAMREGQIRFVVCTSTLAQGVNLPIRYLIVTSVYQGPERIKVRDFHNLIGRAGRAGMHTEGSILFADPIVYDKRRSRDDKWRWEQVKNLLQPSNSEPCISNLLSLFDAIKSADGKYTIDMEAMDFVKHYIRDPDSIVKISDEIVQRHGEKGFSKDDIERQIYWKINLIVSIESFLLAHWDENGNVLGESDVVHLAEETLAYFLADETKKEQIRELFKILAENISKNISDPSRRKVYGRTLYGVRDSQAIAGWVQIKISELLSVNNDNEFLDIIWPLLAIHVHNRVFNKIDQPTVLLTMAQEWIQGNPFHELLDIIKRREVKLIWGKKKRELKIDQVVDICEGGIAYDGSLLVGAITEFVEFLDHERTSALVGRLQLFQKKLKYGLPTVAAISIYEIGFSDRVIALDLASSLSLINEQKKDVIMALKNNKEQAILVIKKYPSYFQERMQEFL